MNTIRVVDAHMHLGAPWQVFSHGWELPDILRLMDRLGIDRSYSTHHFWLDGRMEEGRSASLRAYDESEGRIAFLGVFDPCRDKQSLATLEACLDHPGFVGIKIHPSFHGTSADDPSYETIWEFAQAHQKPILSHTWSLTHNPTQRLSLPHLFEKYISRSPCVKFVMGHAGGPGDGRTQAIRLARDYPNVYLDISGDVFFFDQIRCLIEGAGSDRVLFGTDQPWVDPRAHLARALLAEITDEQKRLLLAENALRVFEPQLLQEEKC